MNVHRILRKCAAVAAALLFSSCASTVQSRIEQNPGVFDTLSEKEKQLVQQGQIGRGMPKGGVFLAWGRPDHVTRGHHDGKDFEAWRYSAYEPVYTQTIGLGVGFGPYGRYGWDPGYAYSTDIYYRPHTAARVDFHDNRVTGWESVR